MTYKRTAEILIKRVEEMRVFQEKAIKTGSPIDAAFARIAERQVDRMCAHFRTKGFNPDSVKPVIVK